MSTIEAFLLGAIQGVTEFLPVSSSGHLVFFKHLFGYEEPMVAFDVMVHMATLVAVLIYFRKEIPEMFKKIHYVIIATLPTVLIAFLFKDFFKGLFGMLWAVGVAWFIMGALLLWSRRLQNGERALDKIRVRDVLLMGIAQGIAIVPGISRAGSTIFMGMLCGLEKKDAGRFSFWMAIPAILGASVLELKDGVLFSEMTVPAIMAAFIAALVVGYISIVFLFKLLQGGRFYLFSFYLFFMSAAAFILTFLRSSA